MTIGYAIEFQPVDSLACDAPQPADRTILNGKEYSPPVSSLRIVRFPVNSTYHGRAANNPLFSSGDSQPEWLAADIQPFSSSSSFIYIFSFIHWCHAS